MEPQTQDPQASQPGQQSQPPVDPTMQAPQPMQGQGMMQQGGAVQAESVAPVAPQPMPVQEPVAQAAPAPSMAQLAGQTQMSGVPVGSQQVPAASTQAPVAAQPAVTQAPTAQAPTPDQAQATPVQPAELESARMASASAAPEQRAVNGGTKILVVEDEVDARTMFVDLLSSEGYEVSSAVDGVDALAKAAADKFNLILLDIVMPNKDGIEVLQEIKTNVDKYGEPVVVMLTNISGDAAIEKAMELGAAGFRLKVDTEPTQLLSDVKDFLSGKVQNVDQEPVSRTIT